MNKVDLSGAVWRKSSRSSGNGACVEVAFVATATAMRDSKNPAGGALVLTPSTWSTFLKDLDTHGVR